jgi:hypothetical protein
MEFGKWTGTGTRVGFVDFSFLFFSFLIARPGLGYSEAQLLEALLG